jgi:hypothetical protein
MDQKFTAFLIEMGISEEEYRGYTGEVKRDFVKIFKTGNCTSF